MYVKYQKYKHVVLAVDTALFSVIDGVLKVLVIKMKKVPFVGLWALPGGLINIDESIDVAARRILREKAGVERVYLKQLAAFGDVERDPFGRVVSVAYFALVPAEQLHPKTTSEYAGVEWRPVIDFATMAYDHKEILECALARLKNEIMHSDIARNLLSREFSLSDLQHLHEIVIGEKLDKRNFRKHILATGLIGETGKKKRVGVSRPAKIYHFL